MVYVPENETHKLLWNFVIQTDPIISVGRPDLKIITKKKKKDKIISRIVYFAVPVDHRVKLKESKKKDMYLGSARDLKKKLWNMKETVIPIVIGVHGSVNKGLGDLEIRGRVETIQTTALLKSARIVRRVLVT